MAETDGRLAENILYFARALRAAGIPVGPGAVLDALEALKTAGVGTREDFYWTLHAVFVKRHEHTILFDQAFRIFFRRRGYIDQLMAMMMPQAPASAPQAPQAGATRIHEALLFRARRQAEKRARDRARCAPDGVRPRGAAKKGFRANDQRRDRRRKRGDEAPGPAACRSAHAALAPHMHGHLIDIRRTLRASMKGGGDFIDLRFIGPKTKPPPIVALLDISGSMSQYSRVFLHFLHALTDARKRVSTFLFGTRLTNVTRALRERDPDDALASCSAAVPDWSGGTRIASSLRAFNKLWARRVLTQGADRPSHHRWARARRRRQPCFRDRPAAPLLPAADLAQSAVALRGLRGARPRHQDHAALCRRISPDPQSGIDDRAGGRADQGRRLRRPQSVDAKGGIKTYISYDQCAIFSRI